jgi:hypothetical protein
MAPRTGLEPVTYRLTAGCSTIELSRNVEQNGAGDEIRTRDFHLGKVTLYH